MRPHHQVCDVCDAYAVREECDAAPHHHPAALSWSLCQATANRRQLASSRQEAPEQATYPRALALRPTREASRNG